MRGSVEAAKDVFAARAVTTPQTSPSRRQPRRVGSTSSLLSDATTSTPELRSPILWAGSDDSEDESLGGASEDTIFLGGSDEGSSMFLSSSPPASPARSEGTCVDSDNGYMSDNTASSVEGIVGGIQLSIDTSGAKHGNVWRRSAAAASPVTEAKQRARAAWMRAGGRDGISAA
ncbi:hypothetical protein HK101_001021 [Irineochytrium annulatum]|nr:hypothetical protein HK101_001021 [Irineochytrium annulatum]